MDGTKPDIPQPGQEKAAQQKPFVVFKSVQHAMDAVQNEGALSVWKDLDEFGADEMHPRYLTFFDLKIQKEFEETLEAERKARPGTEESLELSDKLRKLVGGRGNFSEGSILQVYKNGEWLVSPEHLLENEEDQASQDEDDEWFDAQREHFRQRDNPEPYIVPNEPWRREVMEKAIEIAKKDGRGAPEEADFNTAMIVLGDRIPKSERERLKEDLTAIEEGRSSGNS